MGGFLGLTGPGRRNVTERHEFMTFVSRSRTRAVGALADVQGPIHGEVDINADFDFSDSREDHSGQFYRNIQDVYRFYVQLLRSFNINPHP